ncbi:hypothetical protein IGI04_000960 [Brassica rapa subsp. trilocularis]|uniref:Uncharacterized protein n=1 Tax=Brassica rapa subsp. trilocularis TaxID=1813537 RepID=A0ABQ7NR92_BRACM|nr:hypothetical protein IGI04_000960 [Brassica rapa subsp. trilocularis]
MAACGFAEEALFTGWILELGGFTCVICLAWCLAEEAQLFVVQKVTIWFTNACKVIRSSYGSHLFGRGGELSMTPVEPEVPFFLFVSLRSRLREAERGGFFVSPLVLRSIVLENILWISTSKPKSPCHLTVHVAVIQTAFFTGHKCCNGSKGEEKVETLLSTSINRYQPVIIEVGSRVMISGLYVCLSLEWVESFVK